MKILIAAVLFTRLLAADALALYLSWYGDPATTMTIQWHTPLEEPSDAVEIQPLGQDWIKRAGSHQDLGDRLVHKMELDRLTPDTEYSFRLGEDPAIYKFRTAPLTLERPLRFCIGGDLYHTTDLFRKMCRVVRDKDPLFVVLGGDIAYAITKNPFRLRSTPRNQWFAFLQEWKEEMISPEGQVIPFLIVPGNHDVSPDHAELFFDLFAFPEKNLYRTIDFGNYLSLFLLDTDIVDPIEGKQAEWLRQSFDSRTQVPFQFAVYHIGAYPSVYPYSGEIPQKIREFWCPIFDQYDLPVAFENHNHSFKRTFPIRNNKIDPQGVIYFGDGCWGTVPRKTNRAWYLAKRKQINNAYLIELSAKSAKIEAVGLQGEQIDSVEILPKRTDTKIRS